MQLEMHQHEVCDKCPNVRIVAEEIEIDVAIEPGMDHGDLIKYPGQGEFEVDGDSGDLIIGIELVPHQVSANSSLTFFHAFRHFIALELICIQMSLFHYR